MTRSEVKNRKATIMLLTISGFHVLYLITVLLMVQTAGLFATFFTIVYLNLLAIRPSLNVIIYCVFGQRIRDGFKKLCCFWVCLCKRGENRGDVGGGSTSQGQEGSGLSATTGI